MAVRVSAGCPGGDRRRRTRDAGRPVRELHGALRTAPGPSEFRRAGLLRGARRLLRAVAVWLAAQGLGKGRRRDHDAERLAYPAVIFGVLLAGCTVVNVKPLYTPRELTAQLNDSGARILVVLENFAHTVAAALPDLSLERVVLAGPGDGLGLKGRLITLASRHLKRAVPAYRFPAARRPVRRRGGPGRHRKPGIRVPVGPEEIWPSCNIPGGSTGVAKAAMLTHRNIMANVEQSRLWFGLSAEDGARRASWSRRCRSTTSSRHLLLLLLHEGRGLVPADRQSARREGVHRDPQGQPVHTFLRGQHALQPAHQSPGIEEVDFSNLDFVIAGGMAVQASVPSPRGGRPSRGRPILEGYGLSETSPWSARNPPGSRPGRDDRVSVPLDGRGDPRSRGRCGEGAAGRTLRAGSPGHGRCYWKRPDETGRDDAGRLFPARGRGGSRTRRQVRIVDRMKDMILVSGFNVYPNEIEDVLAAIGCARMRRGRGRQRGDGEMVVAHVVPRDGVTTPDDLRTTRARNSPATRCRAGSSSTMPCRRPMWARCCGGPRDDPRRLSRRVSPNGVRRPRLAGRSPRTDVRTRMALGAHAAGGTTMLIRHRRGWEIPEHLATPERVFLDRRTLLGGTAGLAARLAPRHRARAGRRRPHRRPLPGPAQRSVHPRPRSDAGEVQRGLQQLL